MASTLVTLIVPGTTEAVVKTVVRTTRIKTATSDVVLLEFDNAPPEQHLATASLDVTLPI